MRSDWRQRIATEWSYFDQGRYIVQAIVQLGLFPAAILRYLGAPLWVLPVVAPLAIGLSIVVGRMHNRIGWARHGAVVPLSENLSRPAMVELVHRKRLFDKLGIPWNNVPDRLPAEVLLPLYIPKKEG